MNHPSCGDWSSDVCSSDLHCQVFFREFADQSPIVSQQLAIAAPPRPK
jgi:hypothetical protein